MLLLHLLLTRSHVPRELHVTQVVPVHVRQVRLALNVHDLSRLSLSPVFVDGAADILVISGGHVSTRHGGIPIEVLLVT